MRDGVADVLAQRASLDRGAGVGVFVSLLLHGGLTALAVYAATHAPAPKPAQMVQIEFAPAPRAAAPAPAVARPATPTPAPAPVTKIEEPKPVIEEPKPLVEQPPAKPQKDTVPLDAFGRSTKKGSETPAVAKPTPAPAAPAIPGIGTTTDVPVGGAGVAGIEGGDFPYALYIQAMHRRVGPNWFRPQGVRPGTEVIIYFRVARNGAISETRVEQTSGNATFDRAAVSAVRSSSPLNPLPFDYRGTYLGIRMVFK